MSQEVAVSEVPTRYAVSVVARGFTDPRSGERKHVILTGDTVKVNGEYEVGVTIPAEEVLRWARTLADIRERREFGGEEQPRGAA